MATTLIMRSASCMCGTGAIQFPSTMFPTISGTSCCVSPESRNLLGSFAFERTLVYPMTY
eukprot:2575606-Pyramimonas_sp.AAC.1